MERMCKEELLRVIQSTNFVVLEMGLYLNTHPECSCALKKYCECKEMLEEATKVYERRFGPLTMYGVDCDEKWSWVEEPWPWQKGCDC